MADSEASTAVSAGTLYDKVWGLHKVAELPGGASQLFIGLHLIHEVTSPQAFAGLKDLGLSVRHPDRKSTRLNSSHIPLSRMPSSA